MADTAPADGKVTAEPVSAKPAPAAALTSTSTAPANMAVESNPIDGKLEGKPGVARDGVESPAAKQETNGAPEAVMQEPKPTAASPIETESEETAKKNEKAGNTDKAMAAETSGDVGVVETKDAADPESKLEPKMGEKRKANQQANTNGSNGNVDEEAIADKSNKFPAAKATAIAGKKQKTNRTEEPAPARKAGRKKREKKLMAPVGKTARRTRSQGLV